MLFRSFLRRFFLKFFCVIIVVFFVLLLLLIFVQHGIRAKIETHVVNAPVLSLISTLQPQVPQSTCVVVDSPCRSLLLFRSATLQPMHPACRCCQNPPHSLHRLCQDFLHCHLRTICTIATANRTLCIVTACASCTIVSGVTLLIQVHECSPSPESALLRYHQFYDFFLVGFFVFQQICFQLCKPVSIFTGFAASV